VAPSIEHGGQALQDTVAPKVAQLMSTAARRIAPDARRGPRWRKPISVAGLTAAAGAVAALVTRRRKQENLASAEDIGQDQAESHHTTA
jgi:hypothetical protein